MSLPVIDPLPLGGMLVLIAALSLSLGGVALVLYSVRMTRKAVARRVDMIRPNANVLIHSVPLAMALIRSGPQGLGEREQREVARMLSKFGVPAGRAAVILTGARLLTIIALAVFCFVAASHWPPIAARKAIPVLLATAGGIAGWFVPALIISKLIKSRTKSIVAGLPDALELLVICVDAGLAFEDGIDRIAGALQMSQPALADELALASADLKILPSREQALSNLARRVDTPSVRSVVTTLSQTLRYGTPLAQALRMVARELRNDSLVRLEERANQLPTLMTIPMILFIMPTIFMIVAGPAALRMMDMFMH